MRKGDVAWGAALAAALAPFASPAVMAFSAERPYLMGFAKFAVLATMGELLVIRMSKGRWERPAGLWARVLVWGVVGLLVVLMFAVFSAGVQAAAAKGLLFVGDGPLKAFLLAFYTSAIMNATFGPVFMAGHRISDAWIDRRFGEARTGGAGAPAPRSPGALGRAVEAVDWRRFLDFVVARTIPFFWIPAHTACFLLPPEYRVLAAALLSIALGAILTWGKRAKPA